MGAFSFYCFTIQFILVFLIMPKKFKRLFLFAIVVLFTISCQKDKQRTIQNQSKLNQLKLNQLQIIGSHNSYHKHMNNNLYNFLKNLDFILPKEYKISELDYEHESLYDQLDMYQLRGFEIDIYADPNGNHFYNRAGNSLIQKPTASGINELKQPGFKVLHIPDIDFETYFYTFKENLNALKIWSDAHPNHLPIFLHIEAKESGIGDAVALLGILGFKPCIKFTPALADAIDLEIKSIFGNDLKKVITPDKVRGNFPTLKEAVLANNWPSIGESRGKFIFVMEGGANEEYLQGHPSLQNRAMFLYTEDDKNPESAFIIYNDAMDDEDSIKLSVTNHYIVRTRADGINKQNKTNDYTQQLAAFRSGAQIISTDYYRPDPRYTTQPTQYSSYSCQFPNGDIARINPISAVDKQGIGVFAE